MENFNFIINKLNEICFEQVTIDGLNKTAIEYSKSVDKVFDYSEQSIEILETILDDLSEKLKLEEPSQNDIWNVSLIFGVYLGETLLRNLLSEKGYSWMLEDQTPMLILDNSYSMSPVSKVYKRLREGSVDSVKTFYDVAISIAQGKFTLPK